VIDVAVASIPVSVGKQMIVMSVVLAACAWTNIFSLYTNEPAMHDEIFPQ